MTFGDKLFLVIFCGVANRVERIERRQIFHEIKTKQKKTLENKIQPVA